MLYILIHIFHYSPLKKSKFCEYVERKAPPRLRVHIKLRVASADNRFCHILSLEANRMSSYTCSHLNVARFAEARNAKRP
jgi:hypothetical protein